MQGTLFLIFAGWALPLGIVMVVAGAHGRSARHFWWAAPLGWPGMIAASIVMARPSGPAPKLTEEWRRYYLHVRQCPGFRCRKQGPAPGCVEGGEVWSEYEEACTRLFAEPGAGRELRPSRRLRVAGWSVTAVALALSAGLLLDPGVWHTCPGPPDDFGMPGMPLPFPFGCP